MFCRNTGGQGGMAHAPPGQDLAVRAFGGVRVVVPGIVPWVALLIQPAIIPQVRIDAGVRMQAVVALIGLKPALGYQNAKL